MPARQSIHCFPEMVRSTQLAARIGTSYQALQTANALVSREEQHVPKSNVQRRHLLADDGLNDHQPQSRGPCLAAAAMCSAVIMVTYIRSRQATAFKLHHQSIADIILLTMPAQRHSRQVLR